VREGYDAQKKTRRKNSQRALNYYMKVSERQDTPRPLKKSRNCVMLSEAKHLLTEKIHIIRFNCEIRQRSGCASPAF